MKGHSQTINTSESRGEVLALNEATPRPEIAAALLTGGSDKPYVFGLVTELATKGASLDLIGSDELDCPEFRSDPKVRFLKLRGDQRPDVNIITKISRVATYYAKLIAYAMSAKPKIFHILWNNRIDIFDRTLLLLYYKLLGKKIVLTVHNVNQRKRDSNDSFLNRLTLGIQYHLADHLFVHTGKMKQQLLEEFGTQPGRVSVIPFGINNAVPNTAMSGGEARKRLGLQDNEKAILFFGRITPYKGLDYLIRACQQVSPEFGDRRLIIAGRLDADGEYWKTIEKLSREGVRSGRILLRAEFIPDAETEVYFKSADVLVLPYRDICQSGVLFLAHSFGLPVLAADVGSFRDEIVEGENGFMFKPGDPDDLAKTIDRYFASDLFAQLNSRRNGIREYALERHSWSDVGDHTMAAYASLLKTAP